MPVIELKNVSKSYLLRFQKGALVKDVIPRIFAPKITRNFWALQDINLKVEKGEVVGIIGDNGAGKTTLLSIIARITSPSEGSVNTQGRIYPLLTLGAGFHRELSGEDNIYLNGLLLGLSLQEIKSRLEKIVEFSELGSFIKMPIYTYSSGMLLRLGFSIAVEVDFDILLLDEILTVGDISFQEKCIRRIKDFIAKGKTLLISSQSLDMVGELSNRVILLERGRIKLEGEPGEVIEYYKSDKERKKIFLSERMGKRLELVRNLSHDIVRIRDSWGKRFGNGKAEILKVEFQDSEGKPKDVFQTGESLQIKVEAIVKANIYNPHFGIAIFRDDYTYCYGPNTRFDGIKITQLKPQKLSFGIEYPKLILGDGNYKVSVAIWDEEEKDPYVYHCACYDLIVKNPRFMKGLLELEQKWHLLFPYRKDLKGELDYDSRVVFSQGEKKARIENAPRFVNIFLSDRRQKKREIFFTNECLSLMLEILNEREERDFSLGIILLTLDGVLCHQSGRRINFAPGVKIYFEYPSLHLLTGEYMLFCFLGDENVQKVYHSSFKRFTVLSKMRDHGIGFMEHRWKLNYKKR